MGVQKSPFNKLLRKGSGRTGSGIVGILIVGVAEEGKMWAEGPYLHPISADLPSLLIG